MTDIAQTMTPKQIAAFLGVSGKKFRKFLRKDAELEGYETPGKGGRWMIPVESLESLNERYNAWNARTDADDADAAADQDQAEVLEALEEDEELEELEV